MDRRKFIKSSMCLGCGATLFPIIPSSLAQEYLTTSSLTPEYLAKFSKDKFIYKRKEDLPKEIRLEACSLCNLNCKRCWVRENEQKISETVGFGYLKFKNFKKLIDDNPQIKSIELSNNGEIFLNPELDKIIEYSYKKNVYLTAYNGVNLNVLSDEMAECLVANQFKEIVISIDGATPETYKIYRVGGDFNKVIENIQKINKYKKKYNSGYPSLTWKFIVFGHNEHEMDLAKQKAKELGIGFYFAQNTVTDYSPVKNKESVLKETNINYDKTICEEDVLKYCSFLFERPQIDWNGNVLGCCCTLPFQNFGVNIFKDGLMKALNSHPIVAAKNLLLNPYYTVPKELDFPCKNCYHYHSLVVPKLNKLKNG